MFPKFCSRTPYEMSNVIGRQHCSYIVNSSPLGQSGRYFADDILKRIFLEWKYLNFKWNFIEICSLGSNWRYVSIGLAPSRRQAIIWTNADPVHRRIYAALRGDELSYWLKLLTKICLRVRFKNNLCVQTQNHVEYICKTLINWCWSHHCKNLHMSCQIVIRNVWSLRPQGVHTTVHQWVQWDVMRVVAGRVLCCTRWKIQLVLTEIETHYDTTTTFNVKMPCRRSGFSDLFALVL